MLADHHSSSFAHKLKSSICCFRGSEQQHDFLAHSPPTRPPSPCSLLNELPELRDRCRYLLARIGRARARRRYHGSADFSYDSSSYALNFEDDCRHDDDEFPLRDFTARLPAIKERVPPAKYGGSQAGITLAACS